MWNNWTATIAMMVVAAVILSRNQEVDAKRGCATFGHSCYGGMGKRSGEVINPNEEDLVEEIQQEDNPEIVFTGPRSDFSRNTEQRQLTTQDLYNLSPFIRQWLRSIKNSQGQGNAYMG